MVVVVPVAVVEGEHPDAARAGHVRRGLPEDDAPAVGAPLIVGEGARGGVDPGLAYESLSPAAPHQTVRADLPHTASLNVHRTPLEPAGWRTGGEAHRSSP